MYKPHFRAKISGSKSWVTLYVQNYLSIGDKFLSNWHSSGVQI